MSERLFTSPHEVSISLTTPLYFLAGPIQGAPNWQTGFAERLLAERPEAAVASPKRTPEDQARFEPMEQKRWEHGSLERAKQYGAIGIWFAAQDLEDASYPKGRAYAQTTRIEFGKVYGWKQENPDVKFVLGFDPDYKTKGGGSEDYIRTEMELQGWPVYSSEEDFLHALIRIKFVRQPLFRPRRRHMPTFAEVAGPEAAAAYREHFEDQERQVLERRAEARRRGETDPMTDALTPPGL